MYEFTAESLRALADEIDRNGDDATCVTVDGRYLTAHNIRSGKSVSIFGREAILTGPLKVIYARPSQRGD